MVHSNQGACTTDLKEQNLWDFCAKNDLILNFQSKCHSSENYGWVGEPCGHREEKKTTSIISIPLSNAFFIALVCSNTHPFGKSLLSPPGHPVSQPQVCPWVCFPLALAAKIFQDLWYHFGVARQPHTTLARFPYLGQIVLYYLLKGLENFLSISQNIIHFKPFSKLHRTVSLRHGGLGNVRWCSLATSKWQLRSYNTISFDSLISSRLAFFSLVKVVMSVLVQTLLLYLGFNPPPTRNLFSSCFQQHLP